MKRATMIAGLFILVLAFSLSGCGFSPEKTDGIGNVTLVMGSGAKTIQPADASITVTGYSVTGTGPAGATLSSTAQTSTTFTISNLSAGDWTLTVNGNDTTGTTIATGSVAVTIIAGTTVYAGVTLAPFSGAGVTGTFTMAANWTAPLVVTQVSGTITPVGGTEQSFSATISGSTANYSIATLAAGSYIVLLNATESGGETFRSIYALRVYKNLVSPLSIAFVKADFMKPTAMPTFTPGAGTYEGTQAVTITSTSPGVSIRYTTDGSSPTATTGTIYEVPVSVTSTKTLKAIAYRTGWTTSSVASAAYIINGNGGITVTNPWNPTITFSGQQSPIAYGSSMTVTATVTSLPDSYAWYLDGTQIAGATSATVTLGGSAFIGSHVVTLIVAKGTSLASEQFGFTVEAPPTNVLYNTDFSTNPNWDTNNSSRYHWDSSTKTYYTENYTNSGNWATTTVNYSGGSFQYTVDVMPTERDTGDVCFGLFDQNRNSNSNIGEKAYVLLGGYSPVVYLIAVSQTGSVCESTKGTMQVNKWHSITVTYDAITKKISIEVKRDGQSVLSWSGIISGGFSSSLDYLGVSMNGSWSTSGRFEKAFIDNVKLSSPVTLSLLEQNRVGSHPSVRTLIIPQVF